MACEIEIRPAEPGDVDVLVKLNMAMALETESKQLARQTVTRGVRALLRNSQAGFYLVATVQCRVVACLMVTFEWSDWRNGCFWWIQSVYVEPACRRQGIFRRLYEHVGRLARQQPEVCGLRLYVEQDNHVAQTTYRSLGMSSSPYRVYECEFA